MAVKRPPLAQLGGYEGYALYESEFDRLYCSGAKTVDVRGLEVVFREIEGEHPCKHVCFKRMGTDADPYGKKPRDAWSQERAERIGWIGALLAEPTAIYESHQGSGCHVYIGYVESDPWVKPQADERYLVIVAPEADGTVSLVTAFPCPPKYWNDVRQGVRIWPPKATSKGSKKKRPKGKGGS